VPEEDEAKMKNIFAIIGFVRKDFMEN